MNWYRVISFIEFYDIPFRGKGPRKGHKQSRATCDKKRNSHLGMKYSQESLDKRAPASDRLRKHRSDFMLSRWQDPIYRKEGLRHLEEMQKLSNMSEANIKRSNTMKGRTPKARLMGKRETFIERGVKLILSSWRIEFERERKFENIKGIGAVDFYLPRFNLVIECDGEAWHSKPDAVERDKKKNRVLKSNGIKVLRLRGKDIVKRNSTVCGKIYGSLLSCGALS